MYTAQKNYYTYLLTNYLLHYNTQSVKLQGYLSLIFRDIGNSEPAVFRGGKIRMCSDIRSPG